jgi:phosphoheptose isomerase
MNAKPQTACFNSAEVGAFVTDYRDRLFEALSSVDTDALTRAMEAVVAAAAAGAHIYSVGNGGSAAIADHLCCDWTKLTHIDGHPPILSTSLTANMPLYSAFANDIEFAEVFARQIRLFGKAGDILVAISSSGNSENIVRAAATGKAVGMTVIGMSGFSGGRLRSTVDISLHVSFDNYGIVEDTHQALMHIIAQHLNTHRKGEEA